MSQGSQRAMNIQNVTQFAILNQPNCHPELVSGSKTVPGQEILKQVQNDTLAWSDKGVLK